MKNYSFEWKKILKRSFLTNLELRICWVTDGTWCRHMYGRQYRQSEWWWSWPPFSALIRQKDRFRFCPLPSRLFPCPSTRHQWPRTFAHPKIEIFTTEYIDLNEKSSFFVIWPVQFCLVYWKKCVYCNSREKASFQFKF